MEEAKVRLSPILSIKYKTQVYLVHLRLRGLIDDTNTCIDMPYCYF